ncbi:MAG: SDR family oxidoreductase [Fimbriimonadaceae bacterium]|nr:SDR family oxidoreductase [Fimbriimonadaceae bacterium]
MATRLRAAVGHSCRAIGGRRWPAGHGVRANCVSPGPVLTRPEMANMTTRLGRAAAPDEIVTMIPYLCSDDDAFVTGQNFVIDGGRSVGAME